jgi:hypothetical protein
MSATRTRAGWVLDEPVECMGRIVRTCRELACYSATLGPFCVSHAEFIVRPTPT